MSCVSCCCGMSRKNASLQMTRVNAARHHEHDDT